jgi:hypothetical protein
MMIPDLEPYKWDIFDHIYVQEGQTQENILKMLKAKYAIDIKYARHRRDAQEI